MSAPSEEARSQTALSPQDTVERALAAARSDDCIVIADESSSANLRWAGNTLTTNGVARSRQLTVIAVSRRGGEARVGVVSRAGVLDHQIPAIVAEAEFAAAEGSPAEDAQPLVSSMTDGTPSPSWQQPASVTEIGVFTRFAAELGATFEAAASGARKLYGFAEHQLTSSFVGTSAGLRLRHDQPTGRLELNAKSADLTRSAWSGVGSRDFTDVDVAQLDADLAQRLDWASRLVKLPAGRYETLLPPTAVADLLIYMYWSSGAKDALDGRTVFSKPGGGTRVGEQLTSMPLSLYGDPAAPGLECAPFVIAHASSRESSVFDNGLPIARTNWIADGTLGALTQTRHTAQQSAQPVTPAIDNLILAAPGAEGTIADLVSRTSRGLLLTCLWYIREVDPQTLLLTGLTRDGVYLVENGEVTGAVNNFRFNESPVGMLSRITEAGATTPTLPREWGDFFTRAAMPPVRVEGFNMSSESQAS
jgi:predicted Zn-dependent protease